METPWEKFKNDIYLKTMDGKGQMMFREFNILDDCVEVYFAGRSERTIPLFDYEVEDVKAFENEMRKKGVFQEQKPRKVKPEKEEWGEPPEKDMVRTLIENNKNDWVFVSEEHAAEELTTRQYKAIKKSLNVNGGYIILKSDLEYYSYRWYNRKYYVQHEELGDNLDKYFEGRQ